MIPKKEDLLVIPPTITKVVGADLAFEHHGDKRAMLLDIRVHVPLDADGIDRLIDPLRKMRPLCPADLIFTAERELQMPEATLRFDVRPCAGTLTLKAHGDPFEFEEARIIGKANRLTFMTGGHGLLALAFRFDAAKYQNRILEMVVRQECTLGFTEVADPDEPTAPPKAADQGELTV